MTSAFYSKKVPNMNLKNIHSGTNGQNFIENVCSDSRIVLCIVNTYRAIPEKNWKGR